MYKVHIKKIATGEIRIFTDKDGIWDDTALWIWTEGNYMCDCNRALFFARAGGEDDTEAWSQKCGDQEVYSVPFIELEDGSRIEIEGK